jgi:hypothetical protein
MDELVKLVVQKTGISEQQAQTAVDTVIGYLKDILPDPIAGQIDGLIADEGSSGSIEDITKGLGGLFSNK